MSNLQHERNHVLDIARLVAILAVIMLHCSAPFVSGYQLFSREYIFGNIFDSVSRLGVPIFIMISGALFLDENRGLTLKKVLNKNVKNLVIITVIWAFFYSAVFNVVFPLLEGTPISIKYLISGILSGHYHMWFLYMIIGLYIISPFLKKFVCKENKGMVLFFIVISLLFQFSTPVIKMVCNFGLNISYINTWKDLFHLDFFGGYITYFLVGWYIVHIGIEQKWLRWLIYSLGALSILIIIVYVHFTGDYINPYVNIGLPVFAYSVSVFLALINLKLKLKEKSAKRITALSNLTFGVYIIHAIILTVLTTLFPYSKYCVLYILVCFVAVVLISFFISYIFSKVPLLKKAIKA